MLLVLYALAATATPLSANPYRFDASAFPTYDLRAAVDPTLQIVEVHGNVSVPATVIGSDGKLTIALSEGVQGLSVVSMDPQRGEAPVHVTSQPDPSVPAELRRWKLDIDKPGTSIVYLRFSYRLPGKSSSIFAVTPEAAFAGGVATAWYPEFIDRNGSRSLGLGDLRITVPSEFVVVDSEKDSSGRSLIHLEHPSYFDFAAGPYRLVRSASGRAEIYLLKAHPAAAGFAARTDTVISALVEEFGPFPRNRFSLVEVPTAAGRSAGFDGASLEGFILAIGSYFDQPYNTAFFGHELSHQWWGGLVRRRGTSGAYLLDEALAQFGSLRAVEKVDGIGPARRYRLHGYPGYYAEYSAFGFLSRSLEGIDAPLTNLPLSDDFLSRRVADTKGMLAWNNLAREFGRDRFGSFLQDFVAQNAYGRVTLDDFFVALRRFAGERGDVVSQWFDSAGAPEINMTWRPERRKVHISLTQAGKPFDLTVPLQITTGKVARRVNLHLTSRRENYLVPAAGHVRSVVLDPDYEILRWTAAFRRKAKAIAPSTRGDIKINYGKNEEAKAEFEKALRSLRRGVDPFALRFRLIRGLGDVAAAEEKWDTSITLYCEAAAMRRRADEQLPELWQAVAQSWLRMGDEARSSSAIEQAAASIGQLAGIGAGTSRPASRSEACRGIAPPQAR